MLQGPAAQGSPTFHPHSRPGTFCLSTEIAPHVPWAFVIAVWSGQTHVCHGFHAYHVADPSWPSPGAWRKDRRAGPLEGPLSWVRPSRCLLTAPLIWGQGPRSERSARLSPEPRGRPQDQPHFTDAETEAPWVSGGADVRGSRPTLVPAEAGGRGPGLGSGIATPRRALGLGVPGLQRPRSPSLPAPL